jgi:NADH-quinone oxidoreductase subunit M
MSAALPVLLAVPAAGAAVLAAAPLSDRAAKALGVLASAATFVVSVVLAARFDYDDAARFQSVVDLRWLPAIDVRFHLGIDGISLPLVLLTTLLTLLCAVWTVGSVPAAGRVRQLLALTLALEVGVLGTFVALDLFVLFLFLVVVLIPL